MLSLRGFTADRRFEENPPDRQIEADDILIIDLGPGESASLAGR
jgi:hypothetical protein